MDDETLSSGLDARHLQVSPHHLRAATLRLIRKRLEILHQENAMPDMHLAEDLDQSIADYLTNLRNKLTKLRSETTLHAMRSLLKKMEAELVRQGLNPKEHIEWVFEELNRETLKFGESK
jgi:hypothetical protein